MSLSVQPAGRPLEAALTMSVTVVLWTRLPLVPVSVSVLVPAGVPVEVVMVTVDEPEPVTDVGLKAAVAPEGRPPAVSVTLPPKPLRAVTVWEPGAAEIEKSAAGVTMSVTVALWTRLPLVPVSVSVLVPAGVPVEVGMVTVEEPEPVTDVGLK